MKKPTSLMILVVALTMCLLVVIAAWLGSQPVEDRSGHAFAAGGNGYIFSTTTPTSTLAGSGWWNEMPTDPSLPGMPPIALATLTPTRTPKPTATPNARTMTATVLTGTATPATTSTPTTTQFPER